MVVRQHRGAPAARLVYRCQQQQAKQEEAKR
jgi:hypothetical protein